MTITDGLHRLYKSRRDRMVDGVCGGIAEYFSLDSTLIRLAWVLLTFLGGAGILVYIVAMIIMPSNPAVVMQGTSTVAPVRSHEKNTRFWGILLIVVGALWFLGNTGIPFFHHWWWWGFSWEAFFPVMLILVGVAFIFGGRNSMAAQPSPYSDATAAEGPAPVSAPRLTKSRSERKIAGVCGGIAAHLGIDPTLVRLAFVLAAFASFGLVFLAYIVLAIILPQEPIAVQV